MITKWQCPKCKMIMNFDVEVAEQDFKCSHCGNRYLIPIENKES